MTILLPREITVDAVSLEHASRLVTIDSTSAPAKFEVCIGSSDTLYGLVQPR